jgi:putative tryptophan/tyrosine transport system substrate-binding protein
MQRLFLHIIVVVCATVGFAATAFAEDVLVLLSIKTTGYMEMLRAVQGSDGGATTKVVNLAEVSDIDIPHLIRSNRVRVVLAVGDKAYHMAKSSVQRTPVIGMLVSDQKPNTYSYLAPPERYLTAIKKLRCKRVGVVLGNQFAAYYHRAMDMAGAYGITLVRLSATSPSGVIDKYISAKENIDALWLLPDTSVLTAGSAEKLLRIAQVQNIPVFAFSSIYLKNGAAVVIEADRTLIGRKAGEEIRSILNDEPFTPQYDNYREIRNTVIIDHLR